MPKALKYEFSWLPTPDVTQELLEECATLFSKHYGVWGTSDSRSGQPIRLTPQRLRDYIDGSQGRVALARYRGELICYAFSIVVDTLPAGKVAWVTQLVCHREHRNRKAATRLLRSIWGFSDYYAWGLVTASPYAVRALEGATARQCLPEELTKKVLAVLVQGQRLVPYVQNCPSTVTMFTSTIDTNFRVSHEGLHKMIREAGKSERWRLGNLEEGQEWLAFTFRDQPLDPRKRQSIFSQLADSDELLKRAYEGMAMDPGHKWMTHEESECDLVIAELNLTKGQTLLDVGCGQGRHAFLLGAKGLKVTGIDFVANWIAKANSRRSEEAAKGVHFLVRDARTYRLPKRKFDRAICLYDVIGSFVDEQDNDRLAENLFFNLKPGGEALVSVMSLPYTRKIATILIGAADPPQVLEKLPPSPTMQESGNIFDPAYFALDEESGVVYRKEQFDLAGQHLPAELIVRDKRYSSSGLTALLQKAGFVVEWTRGVRAGNWTEDLSDEEAKEILAKVRKPE